MRLVFALLCARALALPSTRGRSLEPEEAQKEAVAAARKHYEEELAYATTRTEERLAQAAREAAASRTDGPKCCHCGEFRSEVDFQPNACWQDAEERQPRQGVAQGKKSTKESCKEACLEYGINRDGYQDGRDLGYWKVHMPCALLRDNMYKYNPALLRE